MRVNEYIRLLNPNGTLVKSATISCVGEGRFSLSVATVYNAPRSELYTSERGAKVAFGANFQTKGKWSKPQPFDLTKTDKPTTVSP